MNCHSGFARITCHQYEQGIGAHRKDAKPSAVCFGFLTGLSGKTYIGSEIGKVAL